MVGHFRLVLRQVTDSESNGKKEEKQMSSDTQLAITNNKNMANTLNESTKHSVSNGTGEHVTPLFNEYLTIELYFRSVKY
jgi:hypothetical protein